MAEYDYRVEDKFRRQRDPATGRWVPVNESAVKQPPKLIGENVGRYQVEKRTKFSTDHRPEAGEYFDMLFSEEIHLDGEGARTPIVNTFEEMRLVPTLQHNIRKLGFVKPLPIQRATFSLFRHGFDIIAHAQTGAGKTAAFLIPVVNWILKHKAKHELMPYPTPSPYCIVLPPTRELAEQMFNSAREFTHDTVCKVVVSIGDTSRSATISELRRGVDIYIGTSGRTCDFLANDVMSMNNLKFLIMDEADELIRSDNSFDELSNVVLKKCRAVEHLQTMLFTATDSAELQGFKEVFLKPCATRVVVGKLNNVNPFLKQIIVKAEEYQKREHLLAIMEDHYGPAVSGPVPKTLVFVNTKRRSTVIACFLSLNGFKAYPASGMLTMALRHEAIQALEKGDAHIIVATDVLARGMDLKNISHVINYDVPTRAKWSSYVHRVGRTARLGNEGHSTTFYAPEKDSEMAIILYQWLTNNNQTVPDFLLNEARRQYDKEDLEDQARQEYMKAMQEAVEDTDSSDYD